MFQPFATASMTIAIVAKDELLNLYKQTLLNRFELVLLPLEKKKSLSGQLQTTEADSLELKKDLRLGGVDFIAWMQNFAKKLKMLYVREDYYHFRDLGIKLYDTKGLTVAGAFEQLACAYVNRLMQHGSSIIGNPVFAFKADDIRTAFKNAENRQRQQSVAAADKKEFLLQREYFTLNGSDPGHISHEEFRRCFMEAFFAAVFSYGDWLKKDIYYVNLQQLAGLKHVAN